MDILDLILLVSLIVLLIIYYGSYRRKYWARKKIVSLPPSNFIMGSTGDVFLKKTSLYNYHASMYQRLAPHKYGGYYNFFTPVLVVRDPDLIKTIFTKDFNCFMDRSQALDDKDPLSQNLFNLKGETWRILRAKLTPTFTSGKIKIMFNLMKECTSELIEMIDMSMKKEEIEVKEMMARFTTDVISSCVFGLQSNSQKDPDSIFRQMGRKAFAQTTRQRVVAIIAMIVPKFREIFKISFFEKDVQDFFTSLVAKTIKYREENEVGRNDFLDLLIALKKQEVLTHNTASGETSHVEFTNNLLTAQCFVFFVAGFETSSGTLSFALYELAKHPEIQEKLFAEIHKTLDENGGSFNYECLQQMPFLDQVVCETLRMYPILPSLVRICNEDYLLDGRAVIDKNTRVIIPVKGLHYDPSYYETPTEFNPEHFSKEAREKRHHFTYLPFGEGPRICIGMRFGLMQVKLGLATIIQNYSVSVSPKMSSSLEYTLMSFIPTPKDGVWLKFERRSA